MPIPTGKTPWDEDVFLHREGRKEREEGEKNSDFGIGNWEWESFSDTNLRKFSQIGELEGINLSPCI